MRRSMGRDFSRALQELGWSQGTGQTLRLRGSARDRKTTLGKKIDAQMSWR
jgi:hypothetical protein